MSQIRSFQARFRSFPGTTVPMPLWHHGPMRRRMRLPGGRSVPIHPFALAAYPALFLYAENLREMVPPEQLVLPLVVSVACAAGLLILLRVALGTLSSAALLTSWLVVAFFGYGHAWVLLESHLDEQWNLLAPWLAVTVSIPIAWSWFRIQGLNTALNLLSLALVVFAVVQIGIFQVQLRLAQATTAPSDPEAATNINASEHRPDIYWIVLDRYGSNETMKREFGHDNSAFLDELRERGFFVAEASRANYLMTGLSLLATRDMEYLDGERLREQAARDDDWTPVYQGLRGRWDILEVLDPLGYRFAYIGPRWAPAQDHPEADVSYGPGDAHEFTTVFMETTLLRALSAVSEQRQLDQRRLQYERVVFEWESAHRSIDLAGPKFVHAHIVVPHHPYVFDADGNWLTEQEERSLTWEEGYVGQVLYANNEALNLIDALLDQPAEDRPVIALQSDEGPWPMPYLRDGGRPWADASVDELRQKFEVLNAIYLPGVDAEEAGLHPSISLVNTFRVIFNSYFDARLQLLPDRSFIFRDQRHIYELIDVTDQF